LVSVCSDLISLATAQDHFFGEETCGEKYQTDTVGVVLVVQT
jgi:hypothetical protein